MRTTVAAIFAVAAVAGGAQAQNVDWGQAAQQDLQAIHDALRDNHPAAVMDRDSETFRSWIDAGLTQSQAEVGRVRDAVDYIYMLRGYANGFRDANIEVQPNWAAVDPWYAVAWPGFSTAWRDGGYVVAWSQGGRNMPPVGARLIECDDVPAEDIAKRRLDRYEGDLTLEADRVGTAPYLFWDRANPFVGSQPSQCEFRDGRRTRRFPLTMQIGGEDQRRQAYYAAVGQPPQTPLAVEQWNGGYWIHMRTLDPGAGWDAFFSQVEANREAIRQAPVTVIDLRGSGDGSSQYGYRLANRLWDPEFVLSRTPPTGDIAYRVTPANRQFFVDAVARMQGNPAYAAAAVQYQALIDTFDQAAAAGQQIFRQPGPSAAAVEAPPANPMQGRVIVLTDFACEGGCLDIMDMLMSLPNVAQAGTTTSASSIYIEPTVLPLPSGNARLSYGHKAWLDRQRGSDQPYTPSAELTYKGDPADETALRQWLATAVGG